LGLKSTYAAKVGFWVILTGVLVVMLMTYFGLITPIGKKENAYYLTFHFPSIRGLAKGAKFKINGNEVGLVEAMEISPLSGVDVLVRINDKKYYIHENAEVIITKESLLGSSYIEVTEGVGGFYDRKASAPDQFYLKIAKGSISNGALLHYMVDEKQRVIGQVIEVQPGDSGFDSVLIKQLDTSVILDNTFAFVPKSRVDWVGDNKTVVSYVDVFPPLQEGSYFQGSREAGPEDLIAHIDAIVLQTGDQLKELNVEILNILKQVEGLLTDVEGLIDKKAIEELFSTVKTQIETIGNGIVQITSDVEAIVGENKPRIDATMQNVEATSASLRELAEDPELKDTMKSLNERINRLADQLDKILADVEEISGDPETKKDIKESIHTVRETLDSTSKTVKALQQKLDTVSKIEFSGQVKSRYYPEPDSYYSDIDLFIRMPENGTFCTIGVDQIGEENMFNLQLGYDINESMSARFGVKRSKVGIGMDYHINKFLIKSDLYDPNDIIFDLYGGYGITEDVYLVVGGENLFDEDIFNLGVLVEF
jgi:ABC-type transporter Mla subunit MlaD